MWRKSSWRYFVLGFALTSLVIHFNFLSVQVSRIYEIGVDNAGVRASGVANDRPSGEVGLAAAERLKVRATAQREARVVDQAADSAAWKLHDAAYAGEMLSERLMRG